MNEIRFKQIAVTYGRESAPEAVDEPAVEAPANPEPAAPNPWGRNAAPKKGPWA